MKQVAAPRTPNEVVLRVIVDGGEVPTLTPRPAQVVRLVPGVDCGGSHIPTRILEETFARATGHLLTRVAGRLAQQALLARETGCNQLAAQ